MDHRRIYSSTKATPRARQGDLPIVRGGDNPSRLTPSAHGRDYMMHGPGTRSAGYQPTIIIFAFIADWFREDMDNSDRIATSCELLFCTVIEDCILGYIEEHT